MFYIQTQRIISYFHFSGASFIDGNDDIENTHISNETDSCIFTNEELTKFFKAKNLVQTKDSWLMSGVDNKNVKCFSNMNNYNASVLQGRGLIHYSICIFMTTHSLLIFVIVLLYPAVQIEQKYRHDLPGRQEHFVYIY